MDDSKYEKNAKKYCSLVRKKCMSAYRKRLMPELEGMVFDFCNEHKATTIEELYDRFGRPEDFAVAYIDDMDDHEKSKLLKRARYIKIGVIVAVVIFTIAAIVGAIKFIEWNEQNSQYYYYVEVGTYDEK